MSYVVNNINPRVAIYIDHSNVHHSLKDLHSIDTNWNRWYDPLFLGTKLVGNRQLVEVNFYCAPPPSQLKIKDEKRYWDQLTYYEAVKKLQNTNLFLANLTGPMGSMKEKNLDTQLTTHIIVGAYENRYDQAIIVSNDGDYVSAINAVRKIGKKVEVAIFKGRCSMALTKSADITRRLRIGYFLELQFTKKQ